MYPICSIFFLGCYLFIVLSAPKFGFELFERFASTAYAVEPKGRILFKRTKMRQTEVAIADSIFTFLLAFYY